MSALRALAALLVLAISFAAGAQNLGTLPFSGSSNLAAPGPIGGTTPAAGTFTSVTDTGLTAGRVNYNCTGGLLCDSANLTFVDGTSAMLTIGVGTSSFANQGILTPGINVGNGAGSAVGGGQINIGDSGLNKIVIVAGGGFITSSDSSFWKMSSTTAQGGAKDTGVTRSGAGLVEINNGTLGTFADIKARDFIWDCTVTPIGTTGNVTINKGCGTANIASTATALTLTNSLITANTVFAIAQRTNDATCSFKSVVPAAGSAVINMSTTCTAATSVGFTITSP